MTALPSRDLPLWSQDDLSEAGVPKDHFIAESQLRGKWLWVLGAAVLGWVVIAVAAGFMVGLCSLLLATKSHAHEAPTGWKYPSGCCSNYDCREVAGTAISERPDGYVINGTGEVLAYSDVRLKDSPDGKTHWCSVAGAEDGRTICLFVPPRSF